MGRMLLILAAILVASCADEPPPSPPEYNTTTFIEEAGSEYTSITVRLYTTVSREGGSYILTRNGVTVWGGLLVADDTLVTDTVLTPASTYSYRAFAFRNGALVDSSARLILSTKVSPGT